MEGDSPSLVSNYTGASEDCCPHIGGDKFERQQAHNDATAGLLDLDVYGQSMNRFTTPVFDAILGSAAGEVLGVSKLVAVFRASRVAKVEAAVVKTGGRLGNAATRNQIGKIATELESRGYTITRGGGRFSEEYLKPLAGGRKGGSYLDLTATHPTYGTLRINTVDVYKNGSATLRELRNAARIRTQIAPGEHLLLIPKK